MDGIIAIFVSPIMIDAYEVAVAIAEAADGKKAGPVGVHGKAAAATRGSRGCRQRRVPVYRFPENAAAAMAGSARYRVLRDRPVGKAGDVSRAIPAARERAIAVGAEGGADDAVRARGLARCSPPTASRWRRPADCTSPARKRSTAAARARLSGRSLKAASDAIVHKSDLGGVKLDLANADEVAARVRGLCFAAASRRTEV